MTLIDKNYWNNRYLKNDTGWDVGYPSTPLKAYIDQIKNKDLSILIPGCGRSYEGEYLLKKGFKNIVLNDYSTAAIQALRSRCPILSEAQYNCGDFYKLEGKFDLILEQTFFCAQEPINRQRYIDKIHDLLKPEGKLVGVFFDEIGNIEAPPWGGTQSEYESLFSDKFEIITMEPTYNSIEPRIDRELFIIMEKKAN